MVRVLAGDTKDSRFDSRPFHFQVTTLGKLFTHTHASVTKAPCGLGGIEE